MRSSRRMVRRCKEGPATIYRRESQRTNRRRVERVGMIPSGEKCAYCLHPFASHTEEGCAHNVQCPCLGFEPLEPEKLLEPEHDFMACCGTSCGCRQN